MSVCVTGGKSVKLSFPECSKGTVNSGHGVYVFVCVPIVCVWSALISPCPLMRATGGLTPRPYRRARLCQAESSLIVIIAVSLNRTQCTNNSLPAMFCCVIRNVRADLSLVLSPPCFYRDIQDKQLDWELNRQPCWQPFVVRDLFPV